MKRFAVLLWLPRKRRYRHLGYVQANNAPHAQLVAGERWPDIRQRGTAAYAFRLASLGWSTKVPLDGRQRAKRRRAPRAQPGPGVRIGPCRDPYRLWFVEWTESGGTFRRYFADRAEARAAAKPLRAALRRAAMSSTRS